MIHIVFGPLGAGKTTYARQLSAGEVATYFSIDQWMVDLFGADAPTPLNMPWVTERVERCEHRIWLTAKNVVNCDGNVVLDLGFLKVANREKYIELARQESMQTKMHFVHAKRETRRLRVMARNEHKGDTYALHVTPEMFDFMDEQFENATHNELLTATSIDTEPRANP